MCFLWVTVPEDIAKEHRQAQAPGVKAAVASSSEFGKGRELANN